MGVTTTKKSSELTKIENGVGEGYLLNDNCWGTYIHGILDNKIVIDDLLGSISTEKTLSYQEFKEKNYDALADVLRDSLDIEYMYSQSTIKND